ncbi:hypothetical protein HOS18_gp28 [Aeromonas phage CF7]|uniref:Uncharacterized protein n=2 Tax=Viruses TaxID=10239 RepID=A0A249XLA6_9CAUD|nr:hypothetical protein HOS18_gp28 [Aeromonas phage CF7]ASZ71974.1 hypothetical protein CF7_28 [Aeromonas phage CF7]
MNKAATTARIDATKPNTANKPKAAPVAKPVDLMASILADDKLDDLIAKVIKASTTLQDQIQKVAIAIMAHAYKHGDYSRANTLVTGLGSGVRRAALVEWFFKAGLKVNETTQAFDGWQGAGFIEKHWERITATKWYDCKPEQVWAGFDLNAELARIIKRAEGANAKAEQLRQAGKEIPQDALKIDAETLSKLRGLVVA